MTTVSSTFTSNGVSTILALGNTREDVYFSITGPFDGTVGFQRAVSPSESAWEYVAGPWTDSAVTREGSIKSSPNDKFRMQLTGTVPVVTNGTFASDTAWTKGAGWAIGSGTANATTSSAALSQAITGLVVGATYAVTYTLSANAAGTVSVSLGGGTAGSERSTDATFVDTLVAGSTNALLAFTGTGWTGSVDTVSITPVITYSFNDTSALVRELKDFDGNILETVTQDTHTIILPLTVTAGITAPITGAVTGAVNSVPVAETQALDPSQKCTWFTDFLGDTIPAEMFADLGSGTGNAVALVAGQGGRVEIKTASDDGAITANGSSLELSSLTYRADAGGLVFETRVQFDAVTAVGVFIGFTDQLATGTMEFPIFLVAGDIDSDATNACGVGFDTDGTTDEWFHGGVKAGTDTVPAYSGAAPSITTWYTVRVEVSDAGAVQGFIDGVAIGTAVANAVTATTPLCPVIFAANRGAAARNILVDYFWVQQNR